MKIVKSYAWLRVEITRKFLLLSITAGLALGSCNIYPGLWSWVFGNGYSNNFYSKIVKNNKQFFSKSKSVIKLKPGKLKKIAFFTAVILAGCFAINRLFSEDAPAPIYPNANNGQDNENNLPQQAVVGRVTGLVNWARDSRCGLLVRDSGLISNARFDVGNIQNKVYHLRVDGQWNNTCGPRALVNAHTLGKYFSNNNGVFDQNIDILNDLHKTPSEFFREIGRILGDRAVYSKTFFILQPQPIDLGGQHMQEIIDNYRALDNAPIGIRETDLIEGYHESFNPELIENEDGEQVPLGTKFNLIGSLLDKNIGYYHSYIILNGQFERGNIVDAAQSIGHWISLFVVKTGANEYCWFILDSMNDNDIINSNKIRAYICKLLGQNHQVYDNMIQNNIVNIRKNEDIAGIKKIKDVVGKLKESSEKKKGNNLVLKKDFEKKDLTGTEVVGEITDPVKIDNFKNDLERMLNNKITDLGHMDNTNNKKEIDDLISEINSLKDKIAKCSGFIIE